MIEIPAFESIKAQYFSNEEKFISLRKGETLLDINQTNDRLFLVLEGKFHGFLKEAKMENYPIFEAGKNKFMGAYSYFSTQNHSYAKVVAMEDSKVAYYDKALQDHDQEELTQLMPFLMSIIINDLYERQHFAKKMAKEKQQDVQKLLKAEKMATLGQMAAGLAHELNNSVGVLSSSLEHLEGFIQSCVTGQNNTRLTELFTLGLKEGQIMSSEEARKARKEYEKKLPQLSSSQIRRLSKTGISADQIKKLIGKDSKLADTVYASWEAGCTLHDMKIAANHSSHVVKSVKSLGVAEHQWGKNVDVNNTLKEALAIVSNLTKRVHTDIQLGEIEATDACAGELVQVWINLIKNAIESMIQGKTQEPQLQVVSKQGDKEILVLITDNGPGIPENIMTKIFQPSFTTKVGGLSFGLGLGLSIVQRIITEHDGQISVDSEPGKTTFTIRIPII